MPITFHIRSIWSSFLLCFYYNISICFHLFSAKLKSLADVLHYTTLFVRNATYLYSLTNFRSVLIISNILTNVYELYRCKFLASFSLQILPLPEQRLYFNNWANYLPPPPPRTTYRRLVRPTLRSLHHRLWIRTANRPRHLSR